MKAYFISIIIASLLGTVVAALTPDGKAGGIAKHIKLLTALALLLLAARPIAELARSVSPDLLTGQFSFTENSDAEEKFVEIMSGFAKDELEKALEKKIAEKFGLDPACVCVTCEYRASESGVTFTRAVITLSGKGILVSPVRVEEFVKELTGLDCDCVL